MPNVYTNQVRLKLNSWLSWQFMGFPLKIGIKMPLLASACIRGIRDRFVADSWSNHEFTNTYEFLPIYYDSVTMPKNALRICYELIMIFGIGSLWPTFWTIQNFCNEFPIAQELKELTMNKYESVKNFTNWLRFNYES